MRKKVETGRRTKAKVKAEAKTEAEKKPKLTKEEQELYDAVVRSGFFRLGWNAPRTLDSTIKFFEALADSVHAQWLRAIELKVVPPEDVSPGEGFLFTARMLEGIGSTKEKTGGSRRKKTLRGYGRMSVKEAAEALREYNRWRRGEPPYEWKDGAVETRQMPYSAKDLGVIIERAAELLDRFGK